MHPSETDHPHHWRIAEVDGHESPGFCQTCGMERVFRNWSVVSEALGRAQAGLPPARAPDPLPTRRRWQPAQVG